MGSRQQLNKWSYGKACPSHTFWDARDLRPPQRETSDSLQEAGSHMKQHPAIFVLPPKLPNSDYQHKLTRWPEELQLDLMSHLFAYLIGVFGVFLSDTAFGVWFVKQWCQQKDDFQLWSFLLNLLSFLNVMQLEWPLMTRRWSYFIRKDTKQEK